MFRKLKFEYHESRDPSKDKDVILERNGSIVNVKDRYDQYQLSEQLSKQVIEMIENCHIEKWESNYQPGEGFFALDGYRFKLIYETEKGNNIVEGNNNCPKSFNKLKKTVWMCTNRFINTLIIERLIYHYYDYSSTFTFDCKLIEDRYHIYYEMYSGFNSIKRETKEVILDIKETEKFNEQLIDAGIMNMHVKRNKVFINDVPTWSLMVKTNLDSKSKGYKNNYSYCEEIDNLVNVLDNIAHKCATFAIVSKEEKNWEEEN